VDINLCHLKMRWLVADACTRYICMHTEEKKIRLKIRYTRVRQVNVRGDTEAHASDTNRKHLTVSHLQVRNSISALEKSGTPQINFIIRVSLPINWETQNKPL
jgi:hypothetical protein